MCQDVAGRTAVLIVLVLLPDAVGWFLPGIIKVSHEASYVLKRKEMVQYERCPSSCGRKLNPYCRLRDPLEGHRGEVVSRFHE